MFILSVLLAGFVLPEFIGPHGIWLPFVLCGGAFAVGMIFVFRPFNQKPRRIAAASIASAVVLASAIFAGPELYRNSILEIPDEDVNLREYMPFGDGDAEDPYYTLVKTLNEESALTLTGDLPRLDGATALYPLYSAFIRAAYPDDPKIEYFPYYDLRGDGPEFEAIAVCSTTSYAFENLVDGYADIVFLMGVSEEQRAMVEAKGLELALTPITYRNHRNLLGYSFLFYIQDMIHENKVKFLTVDGIAPTRENIASGGYPFANDFYAVTAKRGGEYLNAGRAGNTDAFIEWILSPQGQSLVDATGYVPIDKKYLWEGDNDH
jgi:ABC-type phosphate transport system substrate-binding protein